jgi:hypothetical protein
MNTRVIAGIILLVVLLPLTVWAAQVPPRPRPDEPAALATVVTVQTAVVTTPVSPTLNAAANGGNTFANNGRVLLNIRNGSAVTLTATISTTYAPAGLTLSNMTVTVPAGQERIAGPFDPTLFNDSGGAVTANWSVTVTVTFAVIGW